MNKAEILTKYKSHIGTLFATIAQELIDSGHFGVGWKTQLPDLMLKLTGNVVINSTIDAQPYALCTCNYCGNTEAGLFERVCPGDHMVEFAVPPCAACLRSQADKTKEEIVEAINDLDEDELNLIGE